MPHIDVNCYYPYENKLQMLHSNSFNLTLELRKHILTQLGEWTLEQNQGLNLGFVP